MNLFELDADRGRTAGHLDTAPHCTTPIAKNEARKKGTDKKE